MPLLESTINAAIGALRIEGRHALAPASRATMASVAAVEDKSRWCRSQTPASPKPAPAAVARTRSHPAPSVEAVSGRTTIKALITAQKLSGKRSAAEAR